jgi:hypothetical protein
MTNRNWINLLNIVVLVCLFLGAVCYFCDMKDDAILMYCIAVYAELRSHDRGRSA